MADTMVAHMDRHNKIGKLRKLPIFFFCMKARRYIKVRILQMLRSQKMTRD